MSPAPYSEVCFISSLLNNLIFHGLFSGSQAERLFLSESNSSRTFVELLRGRDGLPGRDCVPCRDGMKGPPGPPGPQGKVGPAGPKSGGAIYTRWGKSTCPGISGTEEVYSGLTGGTLWSSSGGGSNYLCMPKVPDYTLPFSRSGPAFKTFIYGAEYQHPLLGSLDHNVPCAVCCVSTRSAVLMIPAKTTCPPTWTREYYGYLMTEKYDHKHSSMHECVDRAMESLPGSVRNTDGALFFHIEAVCDVGLPSPPYNNYKELNCVVCSK